MPIRSNIRSISNNKIKQKAEITFEKEGELIFYKQNKGIKLIKIEIEFAQDKYKRTLGLMYRNDLDYSRGMFFIMEKEEPQSFWMRNTFISLDIIFINKDLKIVKIQENTQPLTDDLIPSIENSKYAVEVKGGFCKLNNIEEGDYIKYFTC